MSNTLIGAATLFAQNKAGDDAAAGGMMAVCCGAPVIVMGVLFLLVFVVMWKVFTKAGRPGWEALVPIYNTWILVTEICKKEPLWFVLSLVPFVNIVAAWVICQELAKKFGKTETFGIGLFFLTPIFMAILAFGDAQYQGGRSANARRARQDYGDFDDEEEEERPRRRPARDDDDDDAPPPPKKKKPRDYDDE